MMSYITIRMHQHLELIILKRKQDIKSHFPGLTQNNNLIHLL